MDSKIIARYTARAPGYYLVELRCSDQELLTAIDMEITENHTFSIRLGGYVTPRHIPFHADLIKIAGRLGASVVREDN